MSYIRLASKTHANPGILLKEDGKHQADEPDIHDFSFMRFIIVFKRSPSYTTSLNLANPAELHEAVGSLEICWKNIDFMPVATFSAQLFHPNMLTRIICLAQVTSLWPQIVPVFLELP